MFSRTLGVLSVAALTLSAASVATSSAPKARDEFSIRVWRTQDGLPQGRILAISQSPDGYLWIGTSGGLVRFDGARFVVFDRSNTPAFQEDGILTVLPARDGVLWVGTDGGGVVRYENGAFRNYGSKEGLTNPFVRTLVEDSQGTLWVGTDRGFFRHDHGRFVRIDGTPEVPYIAVTSIIPDPKGRFWVRGSSTALLENGKLTPQSTIAGLPSRSVRLVPARDALLAITPAGLAKLSDTDKPPQIISKLPADLRFRTFLQDRWGNRWIGTQNQGLIRERDGSITTYEAPDSLPDNAVLSMFEDRDANLWVGTGDGLARLSRKVVRTFTSRDGLSDDSVIAVYEDRDGTLWLSTASGSLYRRHGEKLSPFAIHGAEGYTAVRVILHEKNGGYWFGTQGQGVYHLSGGKVTHYTSRDGLRQNDIRALCEDRQGNVWIGTGSGVSRWDGSQFINYYISEGLAYGSVRDIKEDDRGDIWIATDRGLSHVRAGTFQHEPLLETFAGVRVTALHTAADGTLWLATRGRGLYRLKDGKAVQFTTRDGLPNDNLYSILEDKSGTLWLSAPSGIFSVKRAELDAFAAKHADSFAVLLYGTADGLPTVQMSSGSQSSAILSRDGHVWFSSVKGAVIIDPARKPELHVPPVLIEEVLADDKPMPLGEKIVIPAGYHKLEIHFTAFNLLAPERVNFRYKLENYDEAWTSTSTRRVAYYTSLPPGPYTFRVIASDTAAPRLTSEAHVAFQWAPHFYQTAWFYALCVLMVAGAAWMTVHFFARQTKARYALLLAERTRLAREMHDTVIQDCVGISTLLEAASSLRDTDTARMRDLLDHARGQARLTLEEARQAVWDLRHASLGTGVVKTLDEFARQLSNEGSFSIHTEVIGAVVSLDEKIDRNLLLVAREAMRNAVAHAQPSHIEVTLRFEKNEVCIEVADDGCGFQPAAEGYANRSFGLMGMRERVEQLGGAFVLESSPGNGTRVIAHFPLSGKIPSLEQTIA